MKINSTLVGMTISLLPTIPASAFDYTLDIFGNAEERMGDVKVDFQSGSINMMTME